MRRWYASLIKSLIGCICGWFDEVSAPHAADPWWEACDPLLQYPSLKAFVSVVGAGGMWATHLRCSHVHRSSLAVRTILEEPVKPSARRIKRTLLVFQRAVGVSGPPSSSMAAIPPAELIRNYFRAKKQLSSGVVEGLNNKANVTIRKSCGSRTFHVTGTALYHALGKLPEPATGHRFY